MRLRCSPPAVDRRTSATFLCRQGERRYTELMSDRERLHELVESLPTEQVRAWLAILDSPISDEEFFRRLGEAPEEAVDEETTHRILAAERVPGGNLSIEELKTQLEYSSGSIRPMRSR